MDLLLVVGVSLGVCVLSFVLTRLAAAAMRRAAAYFYRAVHPPSLTRLTTVVATRLEEWQAAETEKRGHDLPPPPELVRVLRAFAHQDRPHVSSSLRG